MSELSRIQESVRRWVIECLGYDSAKNCRVRNFRFLEESLELVQSLGCTKGEVLQQLDYTYGRPLGKPKQEVGGVTITLLALCAANGIDFEDAFEQEFTRINDARMMEVIRLKQDSKLGEGPLP